MLGRKLVRAHVETLITKAFARCEQHRMCENISMTSLPVLGAFLLLRQIDYPDASPGPYIANACITRYALNNPGVQQEADVLLPHLVLSVQSRALFGVSRECVYVG
jgi:hypothetical protein